MNQQEIQKFIRDSLEDGYEIEEIKKSLRQQSVEEKSIRKATRTLKARMNQNNKSSAGKKNRGTSNAISSIELNDESYIVKQKMVRNAYKVYDSSDNLVLKAKQKLMKMKEEFPFKDAEDNEVFKVKAQNVMDIAGDYELTDSQTGETVAVLHKDLTIFKHEWTVKNTNEEKIAKIESRSAVVEALRTISNTFSLLPHKYTIKQGEKQLGTIEGQFSLRDKYEINVNPSASHRETIIAAAITIDALEGD